MLTKTVEALESQAVLTNAARVAPLPSSGPGVGMIPRSWRARPTAPSNAPNNPQYCQEAVGGSLLIKDKINKCKQVSSLEKCERSCGFCPLDIDGGI